MTVRIAITTAAIGLAIAAAQPLGAMPLSRIAPRPDAQLVSLSAPTPRMLLIRRAADPVAVEPKWEGWAVPIIGSVRCLPARFVRW